MGAVDASREDSEIVDSSKLIPTMACFILSAGVSVRYRKSREVQRS